MERPRRFGLNRWCLTLSHSHGHDSFALRRHLDSVPPETPDRWRVWESHGNTEPRRFSKPGPERALPIYTVDEPGCGLDDRMVAAVTVPPVVPDQLETLLRRLLPTSLMPASPLKMIPTELESLLQRLLPGVPAPKPTLPPKTGITDMETLLQPSGCAGSGFAGSTGLGT